MLIIISSQSIYSYELLLLRSSYDKDFANRVKAVVYDKVLII